MLEREALIIVVAGVHLSQGDPLTPQDLDRVLLAYSRILAAVQESGHA